MDSDIICSNCNQQYCDDNLPRLLIGCGHTFCQHCLLTFIQQSDGQYMIKCPQDQISMEISRKSVSKFPKNLALIKVIQSKKQNPAFKQNQINVSKITKNSEVHEEQDSNQLISIINSSKFNSSPSYTSRQKIEKPKTPKSKNDKICAIHKKPLDIVCIVDLKKICASCAIFGDHRGHSFKSLEEVSQIQNEYCTSINDIISEKQKLSKQITCTQTKNDLIGLLTSKRNKLRNKILQQYQKIQTKLANKKKQILKKLDQIVKKQESIFKNCMKFDEKLIKDYQKWFKKSDSHLKILQESDFQTRLILLFEGKNIDGDLISEGNQILEQMKVEQENILNEVQKKLQNLNVRVNQQIHEYIDDFISISSENYKQISAIIIKSQSQPLQIPVIQTNSSTINKNMRINQNLTQRNKQQTRTPMYQFNENSYLKVRESPNNLDESLLQNQEAQNQPNIVQFNPRMSAIVLPTTHPSAPLTQRFSIQPNIQPPPPIQKPMQFKLKGLKSPPLELNEIKTEKMSKKKLAKLKISDRYEKIVEALLADSLQVLDLTNAEIGDSNTAIICQNIVGSKVRTLKLIRNKLTDEGIPKILPYLTQITTLNLSQNLLTQNALDILLQNKKYLPNIRTIILSQNKIIERKHKIKIDKLKKLEWNISV